MSKWKKLPPWNKPIHQGCLCCPPVTDTAPMDTIIAVGFGDASISKDGETIYQERPDQKRFKRLRYFERLAAADPNHDWQLTLYAPLRGRVYQRHGKGKWVLVESNQGFA